MMTLNKRTFFLSTTDDRKKREYLSLQKKISMILNMEPGNVRQSDILVIFSQSGEMISKKLYDLIMKFQKKEKKCYIYSKHSDTVREMLRVEKGDFPDSGIYAVVLHAGMKINRYRAYQDIIEK